MRSVPTGSQSKKISHQTDLKRGILGLDWSTPGRVQALLQAPETSVLVLSQINYNHCCLHQRGGKMISWPESVARQGGGVSKTATGQ